MSKSSTKRTWGIAFALAAGAALALTGAALPAQAADDTTALSQHLSEFWSDNGVDQSTVQRLVATFENGGRIDSLTGTEQPVRVETAVSAGVKKSVQVYADGSVAVTSQQIESSQARSISGCTVVSGSGFRSYNHCKVAGDNGLVVLGYYASYTLVQGGFDYISSADGIVANCAITTCSNPTFPTGGTFPKRETSAATAIVIGEIKYVGGTSQLRLDVGRDSATSTFQ